MDVKDSKPAKSPQVQRVQRGDSVSGKQRSSKELTQGQNVRASSAPVELKLSESKPSKKSDQIRNKANSLIGVVNQAKESAEEIEQFAKSIDGIVEQASNEGLSDSRRKVLEDEARQLVGEIKSKAQSISSSASSGKEGEIRTEIEAKIGKALESIFPEVAKDAFGIGDISFSPKDTIVQVRTNIAMARERIDQLKSAVDRASGHLSLAVEELDVASQNEEASRVSVRRLDKALDLAGKTTSRMLKDPDSVLDSIKISPESLSLLED